MPVRTITRKIRDFFLVITHANGCKANTFLQMEGSWERTGKRTWPVKCLLCKHGNLGKKGRHMTHGGPSSAREAETGQISSVLWSVGLSKSVSSRFRDPVSRQKMTSISCRGFNVYHRPSPTPIPPLSPHARTHTGRKGHHSPSSTFKQSPNPNISHAFFFHIFLNLIFSKQKGGRSCRARRGI